MDGGWWNGVPGLDGRVGTGFGWWVVEWVLGPGGYQVQVEWVLGLGGRVGTGFGWWMVKWVLGPGGYQDGYQVQLGWVPDPQISVTFTGD